jgi:hypothetical protein
MSSVPCKDRSGVDTDSDSRCCCHYAVPLEGGFAGVSAIGRSTILAESHMSHSEVPGGWLRAAHSLVEVGKMTLPWIWLGPSRWNTCQALPVNREQKEDLVRLDKSCTVEMGIWKIVACCTLKQFQDIGRMIVSMWVSDLPAVVPLDAKHTVGPENERNNPPCLRQKLRLHWDGFGRERSRLIC